MSTGDQRTDEQRAAEGYERRRGVKPFFAGMRLLPWEQVTPDIRAVYIERVQAVIADPTRWLNSDPATSAFAEGVLGVEKQR